MPGGQKVRARCCPLGRICWCKVVDEMLSEEPAEVPTMLESRDGTSLKASTESHARSRSSGRWT
eukprot:4436705-Amphidinium_carterae.1